MLANSLSRHIKNRKLNTLLENTCTYNTEFAEMCVFETFICSKNIPFSSPEIPLITSMVSGKKVLKVKGMPAFDFLPNEALVLPKMQSMVIDFPNATLAEPTQCVALLVDSGKINEIVYNFNNAVEIEGDSSTWQLNDTVSHLPSNRDINILMSRIISTFTDDIKIKDTLIDLMLQELVVRLLQTKAKHAIIADLGLFKDTRIGETINYILKHLTDKKMNISFLADKVCMSNSNFHKKFKNTIGLSPMNFINEEKIKLAKSLIIQNASFEISDIATKCGYSDANYFIRQFKKYKMITPLQYKKLVENMTEFELGGKLIKS